MQNYACKTCGATLYWDSKTQSLKCHFCDSEFHVSDFEDMTLDTKSFEAASLANIIEQTKPIEEETPVLPSDEPMKEYTNYASDMVMYECNTCGGEIMADKKTMATVCPYCGEAISITSKSVGEFRPELILPFKCSKDKIASILKEYVSKSFLTPQQFKDDSVIEKIQGVYVPFYLHTVSGNVRYIFTGEKSHSRRSGYDKITTYDEFALQVEVATKFDRVPTDASVKLDNTLMDALEPFLYSDVCEYNPAYMAGYLAEQKDESPDEMRSRATRRCLETIDQKAKSEFAGYSKLTRRNRYLNLGGYKAEYVMMPVWLLNVRHGQKKYQFAINGQTYKIVGKLPMDKMKLLKVALGCFGALELVLGGLAMLL